MSGAGLLKSERRGFAKQPVEVSDLPFQFDLNVLFSDWHARNLVFFTAEKPDGPSLLKGLVVNYQST